MKLLLIYLVIINAAGFCFMLIDKHRAKQNLWRIPEKTLLITAVLGGSLGVLMGMRIFRHKTLHLKFSLGVPALLILHIVILIFLWTKTAMAI